jgi:collagen triple helix repeat protein
VQARIIALSAVVLFSATTVWAGSDPVRACVEFKTGKVRLIAADAKCPTGEVLLVWNPTGGWVTEQRLHSTTGPQGPPGPQGSPGLQGGPGLQGPLGLRGGVGPQGPAGPQGAPGPQGPLGLRGGVGPQGPAGPQGPLGLQGLLGLQGPVGPQGPAGVQGPDGAKGPVGAQGPQGLPGPDGKYVGSNASLVVDQDGQEVGVATEPFSGLVLRHVGADAVVFFATAAGPVTASIDFFHTAVDCTDARYLGISGGAGLASFASVHGTSIFYTKTMDPNQTEQVPIRAYEHFEQNEDATLAGVCTPYDGGTASLGVVTMVNDPVLANLRLPLRIR